MLEGTRRSRRFSFRNVECGQEIGGLAELEAA
jgi:hypothetical protein